MRIMLKKSVAKAICRYWGFPLVRKSARDPKLEYFKRKILAHLDELERKEKQEMRKSLAYLERLEKAQKRNVGEVVTWGRKVQHKYIKGADGKWRRYYEGESRGQKLSIAALKRKVDACKDAGELWDLVFANWGRFMDADKMPLPVVRELHAYASKREDEINAGERKAEVKAESAPETKPSKGGGVDAPEKSKSEKEKLFEANKTNLAKLYFEYKAWQQEKKGNFTQREKKRLRQLGKKISELSHVIDASYLYNKDINPHGYSIGAFNPIQLVPGLNFIGLVYGETDYDKAFVITGDIQKEIDAFKQKLANTIKRDKKADEKQAIEAEKKAAQYKIAREEAIQKYQTEKENVLKERKTLRLASVKTKPDMLKKAKEFYSEARKPKDSSETKQQYESKRLQNCYNRYYLETAAKMCDLVGEPVPVTDRIGDDIEKSESMTFEQADSGNVNPNYKKNIEEGFNTNCQTCEVVFMARMAGFDVEALPNKNNAVIDILRKSPLAAYIDKRTGFPPEVFLPNARETAGVLDWAANHFKPATLYAMIVDWKRRKEGHIAFLWKEDAPNGGGFRFKAYDSQTGKIYTGRSEVASFIISSVKNRTAFANLSDCVLNESVCKHIMKKRGLQ